MKDILLMGLTIGCAMMAKMSGAVLAFSMAVFMLITVWEDRAHIKKYIGQFAAFGAVSGVCGLWHSVYNYLRFGVPFDYFPRVNESYDMFLPDYTKWELLFDFKDGLMFLTPQYQRDNGYVEHNILLSVIKHAVFNEGYTYEATDVSKFLGITCFVVVCILFAAYAICSLIWLLNKGTPISLKILVAGATFANALCLIKVVWAQPFVCTMNVRYVLLALCTGAITIGMVCSGRQVLGGFVFGKDRPDRTSGRQKSARAAYHKAVRQGVVYFVSLVFLLISAEWLTSLHLLFNF